MAPKNRQATLLSNIFGGASVATGPEDATGVQFFSIYGLGGTWDLRALWAGEGWPADVARVLEQLPAGPLPRDLVITARSFSPGSIEMLDAREANWADEQGGARIRGLGLHIEKEKRLAPAGPRELSWSPSALAVGEALLARDWPAGVSTSELAQLVDWSPPQVSQVLRSFDERGWTVKYGPQRGPNAHRELSDAGGLLRDWSAAATTREREARVTHGAIRQPLDFLVGELSEMLDQEVRWAAGGWAAAHELAPFIDPVPSLQIYVHEDDFGQALDQVVRAAGLVDTAEGGKVAFFPAAPSVLALGRRRDALPLVSAPRVYADLAAFGGRGLDAAEHLKEEVLSGARSARRDEPPPGLVEWERNCRRRLDELVGDRIETNPYAIGSWSASYRLLGTKFSPSIRELSGILREVAGTETGWPAWWAPAGGQNRPRPLDGTLECWMRDMLPAQPSHADYWRADPQGRLCLIRSYEEDSEMDLEPSTALDLSLPIWRTGECLLHAERMARRLEGDTIQMTMRWFGLKGRRLGTPASPMRRIGGEYICEQEEVVSFVQTDPDAVSAQLPELVRHLVDPLFETFDLFAPPPGIYEEELEKLRSGGRGS